MKVKPVKYEDLGEIYQMEEKTFDQSSFSKELFEKLLNLHLLFLKLEKEDSPKNIIGFLIMIKDKRDRANLINLLIDATYRNRGWGSFLLEQALDRIRMDYPKIHTVVLNVKIGNTPAIHLYKKFNFKIVEKIEDYYQTGESAYVMKLTL